MGQVSSQRARRDRTRPAAADRHHHRRHGLDLHARARSLSLSLPLASLKDRWTLSLSLLSHSFSICSVDERRGKANNSDAIIPHFLDPDPELNSELQISCSHV